MAISKEILEKDIRSAFPDAKITIDDLKGDGDHYALSITSQAFIGLSRVKQHQCVYNALNGKMGGELHALMIKTKTP